MRVSYASKANALTRKNNLDKRKLNKDFGRKVIICLNRDFWVLFCR